ncbi:MAG: Coq4 family protein [Myxococcota bacterium]
MRGRDAYIVVRNTVRVLRDSNRLDDILEVGEVTGRASMQRAVRQLQGIEEGRRLLAERPELNSAHVDLETLATLPLGTVGRLFADHVARYGLDIDALNVPAPTDADSDERYLLRRYRGNHDIWHTMLGLGTEGHEEVLVHAFTFGQLQFPISTLIMLFGTLKHIVLEGRWDVLRHQIRETYELGRACDPLLALYWEEHWETPVEDLRARVGLPATT